MYSNPYQIFWCSKELVIYVRIRYLSRNRLEKWGRARILKKHDKSKIFCGDYLPLGPACCCGESSKVAVHTLQAGALLTKIILLRTVYNCDIVFCSGWGIQRDIRTSDRPSGPKLSKLTWVFNVPLVLSFVLLELLAIATIGTVNDLGVLNENTQLSYDNFWPVGPTEFICISYECCEREWSFCWLDKPESLSCRTKSFDNFLSYSHLPTLQRKKQFLTQCQQ